MNKKSIPLRRCMGCYQSKPKEQLDRYVVSPMEKSFIYDPTGRAPGRGGYICKDSPDCLKKAVKRTRSDFRRDE